MLLEMVVLKLNPNSAADFVVLDRAVDVCRPVNNIGSVLVLA